MANTSSRTLALLSLLQTHRFWPGTELADRLEVSVRTLRRDVERLRDLGYPVTAQPGVDGGYQLAPGASLPPLVLSDDEAVALAVGLRAAAQSSVAGVAESSVQALAKVIQVMPKRLRRQIDAIGAMTEPFTWGPSDATVDPDVLTALAEACRDETQVEFDYTAADETSSHRRVEPHRVVSSGRRWYLVAYDVQRHDWRSFRLDRASTVASTGRRFAPRTLPAADAAEFVRAGLRSFAASRTVRARVFADADAVRRRIGRWSTVTDDGPDRCLATFEADALEWPAFALALTDAEFTVLEPPEFAEFVSDWAARFARASHDH